MPGAPRYLWMEGELRPAAEGVVPFVNAGPDYGFSVFEGIRGYATDRGPAMFRPGRTRGSLARFRAGGRLPRSALHEGANHGGDPQVDRGQWTLGLLHSSSDLAGRSDEQGGGFRQPAPDPCGMGVDGVSGRGGKGARDRSERLFDHAPASERHDDQGQVVGELRGLDPGQDGIAALGFEEAIVLDPNG